MGMRTFRRFKAIVSQLWFWPFWVMFLKLWLKSYCIHIDQRQNMNWPLGDNFEAPNMTFLSKNFASNVQSSCIDNSKRPKSELWHYCIKATICVAPHLLRLLPGPSAATWRMLGWGRGCWTATGGAALPAVPSPPSWWGNCPTLCPNMRNMPSK